MNVTTHDWHIVLMYGLVALMALGFMAYGILTSPRRSRRRHAR